MNKEDRYRRTGNLTLADRGCSHTELWFSGKILPVASQAQGHVARKDEESVSSHQASFTLGYRAMTVSQQHTWSPGPLHSQQTPNVCIQQGCTAAPHSLSTKWWHPFLHVKHGGEEKPINPDLPPERHPWHRASSHKHLETMSETFELARGKVCATPSLAQPI